MTEENYGRRRMRLKSPRAVKSHLMFPTYEGAPFHEAMCGVEHLAEDWVDVPEEQYDEYPLHYQCEVSARVRSERLAA